MREVKRQALIEEEHRLRDLERAQGGTSSTSPWNESSFEHFLSALTEKR
jgi:hypothetical protein